MAGRLGVLVDMAISGITPEVDAIQTRMQATRICAAAVAMSFISLEESTND